MFITDYQLKNLAVYKKQTTLPNTHDLIKQFAAYTFHSMIDLADEYINIIVEESSEKCNTNQTTHD